MLYIKKIDYVRNVFADRSAVNVTYSVKSLNRAPFKQRMNERL